MNHANAYEHRAVRYADGEMDAAEASEFETHLVGCPACRKLVEEHRSALELARGGLAQAPAGNSFFTQTIRDRAAGRRRRVRLGTAAVVGSVAVGAAFGLLHGSEARKPAVVQLPAQRDPELIALEQRIAELEAQVAAMRAKNQRMAEMADLESELTVREIAAIALAAAQHLEESGLDVAGARRQYQLVIDHFAHTPAADIAREHLSAT